MQSRKYPSQLCVSIDPSPDSNQNNHSITVQYLDFGACGVGINGAEASFVTRTREHVGRFSAMDAPLYCIGQYCIIPYEHVR